MGGRTSRIRLGAGVLFGLLLAGQCCFLLWPLFLTVRGGFRASDGTWTLSHILGLWDDPTILSGLTNSILLAAATTLLCLLMTLPLALVAARYTFPGKAILTALLMTPLILPPFVGAIGFKVLFGRFGAVNSALMSVGLLPSDSLGIDFLGGTFLGGRFWAVALVESLHLYPILYLNVVAALANVDPALEESATGLGASPLRRFWRITLPLIMPGIFAGATIVFIWSFTELGTPLMFDFYTVTPVQIFWDIMAMEESPRPYALVVITLAVALSLYVLARWLVGARVYEMKGRASIAAVSTPLRGVHALAAVALFAGVTFFATLPHLGVVFNALSVNGAWYRSVLPASWTLDHFAGALSHDLAMGSVRNSLTYATVAMLVCVIAGVAIAYLNVRVRMRGAALLDGLAMLPLAVPGLVMAFGYVAMTLAWPFGAGGPLEGAVAVVGASPNPMALLVIAYAVRRLPYVVRSVSAGLEQTSEELEEAALNLGAPRWTAVRRVVLPLIAANIIAGAILAFSFSMLEVSDSLILAQKQEHYPITKAIYTLFSRLGDGPFLAGALGVWCMVLLGTTLVGASLLMGKRLGAIFRI